MEDRETLKGELRGVPKVVVRVEDGGRAEGEVVVWPLSSCGASPVAVCDVD